MNILVLGAGNTALDVARSALRLGGKPVAIDWTDERYSKARPDEISEAREEGVEIRFLTTISRVVANRAGKVVEVELFSTAQIDSKSIPTVIAGSGQLMDVDLVVLAMGYRVQDSEKKLSNTVKLGSVPVAHRPVDREWLGSGLFSVAHGLSDLAYDRESSRMEAAFPVDDRIWAVGDVRSGPSTVVSSMAQGISAARGLLAEILPRDTQERGDLPDRVIYRGSVLLVNDDASDLTVKVIEHVGRRFWGAGWLVKQTSISRLSPFDMLGMELIIFGYQSEGVNPGNAHLSKRMVESISHLPPLHGKKVAVLAARSFVSGNPTRQLVELLVGKGANVVDVVSVSRNSFAEDVAKFTAGLLVSR